MESNKHVFHNEGALVDKWITCTPPILFMNKSMKKNLHFQLPLSITSQVLTICTARAQITTVNPE